jgi:5'-nucleotidase
MLKWVRSLVCFWIVAASALLVACATPDAPPTRGALTLSLISFNDFHGHLLPPESESPLTARERSAVNPIPAGGAAYLATLIRQLQAENPKHSLVVAAGDLVGASPPVSGLFHDEPTIDAMNQMGLALSTVGNHEFDKGRDELLRLQNGGCFPPSVDGQQGRVGVDTCMNDGRFEGAKFSYLSANVIDQRSGQTLFPSYAIRELGGVRVGFVGVTLKETPSVVTPKGVEGLRFDDEARSINRLIPAMQREGAAFVVVLLHQGGATRAEAINDAACPGFDGAALHIADQLDAAVEVVITGHTHQEYVCRRPDGKLMTQAGSSGRMATKIDLVVDPASGRVLGKSARTHVAANDALRKETGVDALVQRYARLSAERSARVVARIAAPLERRANPAGESPLGNVLADAYLFGAAHAQYGPRAAQMALVNPGGIRSSLNQGLEVTYGQLYRAHPFNNSLMTLELSGAQLARLLEQQWEAPQPKGGRVLSVSSGVAYAWDASAPAGAARGEGQRLVPGSLKLNGKPIDPGQLYRVVVNSYLASGGDNFSILGQARQIQEGALDLEALIAYFQTQKTVGVPLLDRIQRRN